MAAGDTGGHGGFSFENTSHEASPITSGFWQNVAQWFQHWAVWAEQLPNSRTKFESHSQVLPRFIFLGSQPIFAQGGFTGQGAIHIIRIQVNHGASASGIVCKFDKIRSFAEIFDNG